MCCHRSPAALHPPPAPQLSQEVAAPHEDDVSHQPECGHAPPPPRHRHENTGETLKRDSKLDHHCMTPKALYFPSKVSSCKHFQVVFQFSLCKPPFSFSYLLFPSPRWCIHFQAASWAVPRSVTWMSCWLPGWFLFFWITKNGSSQSQSTCSVL